MFDMLSGGIGAGAKRCKSSWETTNGIREIQLKYNRIKMRKIPLQQKKRRYPEERRKETKWGVPDEMDKNKCQILIWIARCRAAPTAQKEERAAHQKLIMCWPVSLSLLFFFMSKVADNISIDPPKKYKKLACFVRLPGSLSMGHKKKQKKK